MFRATAQQNYLDSESTTSISSPITNAASAEARKRRDNAKAGHGELSVVDRYSLPGRRPYLFALGLAH
jgi:hypothetical protein